MLTYDFNGGCYSLSNETVKKVELGNFDVDFQGQTFEPSISRKPRSSVKMFIMTFTEVNIRHRMASLRFLYCSTLT